MSIVVIIILILFGLFGWSSTSVEGPDCVVDDSCVVTVESTSWMPVEIDGVIGVIVPEADGDLFMSADGHWTPTVDDIALAEEAIAAQEGELDHFRQYVGFIDEGVRKIHINGFTDPMGTDWYSQPVQVEDGGEAFFGATFNVETGTLEGFSFNGEA